MLEQLACQAGLRCPLGIFACTLLLGSHRGHKAAAHNVMTPAIRVLSMLAWNQKLLCGVQAVLELREAADRWEAQAQQGLAQNERLKDLLEESAAWDAAADVAAAAAAAAAAGAEEGSSHAPPPASAARARDGNGQQEEDDEGEGESGSGEEGEEQAPETVLLQLRALCGQLQRQLLEERARSAKLDLQVRQQCRVAVLEQGPVGKEREGVLQSQTDCG